MRGKDHSEGSGSRWENNITSYEMSTGCNRSWGSIVGMATSLWAG